MPHFTTQPAAPAPLDPGFMPAVLFNQAYSRAVRRAGKAVPLELGLDRENGLISRFETNVSPCADRETLRYVERSVKFLLWSRGRLNLHFGGSLSLADRNRMHVPDEKTRRVGQAVAAASLPKITK